MAGTTTTLSEILKTVYEGAPENQLNEKHTFLGELRKKDDYEGDTIKLALRTGRTTSIGYQTETAILPIAGNQSYTNPEIDLKEYYGTIKITQRLMQKAKSNKGAFVRALSSEMEGLTTDFVDYLNLSLLNDGSATLGIVSSSTTQANFTITLSQPEDARRFKVGQVVNIWSVRTNPGVKRIYDTGLSDITISSIDLDTGILTTEQTSTGNKTIAQGDVIAQKDARTETVRIEANGLDALVDDANPPMDTGGLHGLAVASHGYWKSIVLSNSSVNRTLTDRLIRKGLDGVMIRGGSKITHMFTTYGVRMEYAISKENVRRSVNTSKISGGTAGGFMENEDGKDYVHYQNIPIIPDKYVRQNTLYGVNMRNLWLARWMKYHWLDTDGSILKWSPDRSVQWEAVYGGMHEMVTNKRNAHFRIEDLDGDDAG